NLPGRGTNAGVCIGVRGCGGNSVQANEGLLALSDSFRLNITGDFGVKDGTATGFGDAGFGVATLTDTGSKWKTHSSKGGYNVAGVPEPMTILGSGAALAFGALMKRRLSKKQA
ncbi:MAG: PEP-CTERM sorting domain-containing protein, partial [Cyanobacteria bacterium J06576_12]